MRTVVKYENGKPIWSENAPASPGATPLGGTMVQGEPSSFELQRRAEASKRYRDAKAAR